MNGYCSLKKLSSIISIMPIIPSVIQSPMDLKTKKTCHTKNNYQDHSIGISIIKDEISLMKKTISLPEN